MPHFPVDMSPQEEHREDGEQMEEVQPQTDRVRVKNRRLLYLDRHPEYYTSSLLELADPLLYDRCIRRFQSTTEREEEGRKKGFSGTLEADLMRSEAKIASLAHPPPFSSSHASTAAGANGGGVRPEDPREAPSSKEEGQARWREEMTLRFLHGQDDDFKYEDVDESEEWDDHVEEDRAEQEKYFAEEEIEWLTEDRPSKPSGETGVQDY